MKSEYIVLIEKPECKRPFRRLKKRGEDIITDTGEMGLEGADWIDLRQYIGVRRVTVNPVMNLRVHKTL
jgi:hypothetical protein